MNDYVALFAKAQVITKYRPQIQTRLQIILNNRHQYDAVEASTHIPWWCVAAIHNLESSLNFHCHLHNGDPLTARTVHIPRNRPLALPASGHFPYEWYESAIDALSGRWEPPQWDLNGCLAFMERYNGLGYREHGVNSPYLWSFTDQYTSGLFVFDGMYSAKVVSDSAGAAALLKVLQEKGLVQLSSP